MKEAAGKENSMTQICILQVMLNFLIIKTWIKLMRFRFAYPN